MGIGLRNGKIRPAWVLICCLLLTACGGQNGSGNNEAALESRAEDESKADMENQADETQDIALQADETQDTASQTDEAQDNVSQTDNTDEDSTDKAVEGARREEASDDTVVRKLSILGDSISTFDGWIPEGYSCYFPMNGEVMEIGQTWWQRVLQDTGMELCVNSSSSGSTCAGDSTSIDNFQYGCSECRLGNLIGGSGNFPDVIVVYMGANDVLKGIPLGDNDGTQAVEEGMIENFSDAYCMILDKLTAYYPNADIYCCNLPPMGDWGPESGPAFVPFVNSQELTSADYGRQIEKIAAAKGCQMIDLQNCGITMENMEQYVTDGVHMNPEGMELVYKAVMAAMN